MRTVSKSKSMLLVFFVISLLFITLALPAQTSNSGPNNTSAQGKNAEQDTSSGHGLWYYLERGGPFIVILLLFSVAGIAIVIERIIVISRIKAGSEGFEQAIQDAAKKGSIPKLKKLCEEDESDTARILLSGLNSLHRGPERMEKMVETTAELQVSILERGLNLLSSISHLAPLVGFLGTVSGMISAFAAIADAENVSAKLVAAGIFEALITTAAGLIVAIPILAFHNYFVHRIDTFTNNVEKISIGVIEELEKKGKV